MIELKNENRLKYISKLNDFTKMINDSDNLGNAVVVNSTKQLNS